MQKKGEITENGAKKRMRYLPMWTNRIRSLKKQYDLCWIHHCESKIFPYRSLLPLRFYDLYDYYDLNSQFHFGCAIPTHRMPRFSANIMPAEYAFARKVYNTVADRIKEMHPEIEQVSFGKQLPTGIYPIKFAVDYNTLLAEMLDSVDDVLNSAISVDETISIEQSNDSFGGVDISGILDMEYEEIKSLLYGIYFQKISKIPLRTGLRYDKEKVMKYFRVFSPNELLLGNQSNRVYANNEEKYHAFFETARNGDYDKLLNYVKAGYNLNELDMYGTTAFANYLRSQLDFDKDTIDPKKLDVLIALGANPAIYGVDVCFDAPITMATMYTNVFLIKYLLEKGVNPNVYPYIDDLYTETLTERSERWGNDPEVRNPAGQLEIAQLLNDALK